MTTLPSFLARSKVLVSSFKSKYYSQTSSTTWSASASRKESKASGSYWSSRDRKASRASALGSRDEDAVGLDLMKPLPRVYAGPERGRGSDEALTHWYSSSETNV
jgi:hypothetical protein